MRYCWASFLSRFNFIVWLRLEFRATMLVLQSESIRHSLFPFAIIYLHTVFNFNIRFSSLKRTLCSTNCAFLAIAPFFSSQNLQEFLQQNTLDFILPYDTIYWNIILRSWDSMSMRLSILDNCATVKVIVYYRHNSHFDMNFRLSIRIGRRWILFELRHAARSARLSLVVFIGIWFLYMYLSIDI
jgi:hypothetical protein